MPSFLRDVRRASDVPGQRKDLFYRVGNDDKIPFVYTVLKAGLKTSSQGMRISEGVVEGRPVKVLGHTGCEQS